MNDNFQMRLDADRTKLMEEVEDRIGSRITRTSRTAAVEEALKLALKHMDLMEEKEQEIKDSMEEWGTDSVKLDV